MISAMETFRAIRWLWYRIKSAAFLEWGLSEPNFDLPTVLNHSIRLNMSIPTARYFLTNKGMPLIPGEPGQPLSIPINPTVSEAVSSR